MFFSSAVANKKKGILTWIHSYMVADKILPITEISTKSTLRSEDVIKEEVFFFFLLHLPFSFSCPALKKEIRKRLSCSQTSVEIRHRGGRTVGTTLMDLYKALTADLIAENVNTFARTRSFGLHTPPTPHLNSCDMNAGVSSCGWRAFEEKKILEALRKWEEGAGSMVRSGLMHTAVAAIHRR